MDSKGGKEQKRKRTKKGRNSQIFLRMRMEIEKLGKGIREERGKNRGKTRIFPVKHWKLRNGP